MRTMVCAIQVRQRHIQVHLRQNATRVLRQVAGVCEQSEQRTESKEKERKACHVRKVFRHLDETRKRAELPRRNFAQFPLLPQAPEGARSQTPKENYGGRHPSASAGVSVPESSRQVLQNACNDLSRGLSKYKLTTEAGLTQSTYDTMVKRNTPPKIETLQCICNAFGITLAQFFVQDEKAEVLTQEERLFLSYFRNLSPSKRQAVLELIK